MVRAGEGSKYLPLEALTLTEPMYFASNRLSTPNTGAIHGLPNTDVAPTRTFMIE